MSRWSHDRDPQLTDDTFRHPDTDRYCRRCGNALGATGTCPWCEDDETADNRAARKYLDDRWQGGV